MKPLTPWIFFNNKFNLEALQNLYDKTRTTLTRNNNESPHKESKTKSDSSLFTLKGKFEKEEQKGT